MATSPEKRARKPATTGTESASGAGVWRIPDLASSIPEPNCTDPQRFEQEASEKTLDGCSLKVPRLLVSVRNLAEAESALAGGCDILDIKEPAHGAMGMADVATIAAIV